LKTTELVVRTVGDLPELSVLNYHVFEDRTSPASFPASLERSQPDGTPHNVTRRLKPATDTLSIHMSFLRHYVQFAQLLDMPPFALSDASSDSSSSRETSPLIPEHNHAHRDRKSPKPQTSPFLQLPNDLFKCVLDYLDRDAAWSLKRLCRGMASSKAVDEKLYRYPLQPNDVKDIKLHDWKYRSMGQVRWNNFKVGMIHGGIRVGLSAD